MIGSSALVGSSNFTVPGLTQNIELNVQITGTPVAVLQEWYEERWDEAEVVSDEVLKTIERHIREFTPFEIYGRSLQLYFLGMKRRQLNGRSTPPVSTQSWPNISEMVMGDS